MPNPDGTPTQDELDAELLSSHGITLPSSKKLASSADDADAELLAAHGLGPQAAPASVSAPTPTGGDIPFASWTGDRPKFVDNPTSEEFKKSGKAQSLLYDFWYGDPNVVDATPALFPAAAYAGGLVQTPLAEIAKQLQSAYTGKKIDSIKALKDMFTGHAKSGDENLADLGMKPGLLRSGAGLVADTLTNPTTSAWEGVGATPVAGLGEALANQTYASIPFSKAAVEGVQGIPGAANKAMNFVSDNAQAPVSNIMQKLSDTVFNNTRFVKSAEKAMTTGTNSAKLPAGIATDELAKLNLSGNDKEIADKIFEGKKAVGRKIGSAINTAGGDGELQTELAPDFNANAKIKMGKELGLSDDDLVFLQPTNTHDYPPVFHPDDVNDLIKDKAKVHSIQANALMAAGKSQQQAVGGLQKLAGNYDEFSPTRATFDSLIKEAQTNADKVMARAADESRKADAFTKLHSADPSEWITSRLASNSPRIQQSAVQDLHELAPQFSPLWERVGSEIGRSNGVNDAVGTVDNALYDIARGPRSLEDTAQVGYDWNQVASGSKPMRTNKFLQNAKPDLKNELAMELGSTIADVVDNHVNNAVQDAPELANYPDLKRSYHVLSRAGNAAQQTIRNAMTRPAFSKLDKLGAIVAVKTGGLPLLAKAAIGKASNELYQSPQFGVGVSNALKSLSNYQLPDNVLRQGVINSYRPKPSGPRNPWQPLPPKTKEPQNE